MLLFTILASIQLWAQGLAGFPGLSPHEAATAAGYRGETHKVTTEDGYILTVHRITGRGPSVLLQHGLACASNMWTVLEPNRSLAFLLADLGYDVWLGNPRGNRYSQAHISLTPGSDQKFWDFSWHEMAVYDAPAMIDYILAQTGRKSLYYVGHSMGIVMVTGLLATKPQYNKKIDFVFALAPAVYVEEMRSLPLRFFCTIYAPNLHHNLGPQPWLPNIDLFTAANWKVCGENYPLEQLCLLAYTSFAGPTEDVPKEALPLILSVTPTTTSAKTFAHFGQAYFSGKFQPYSYGQKENEAVYKSAEPPQYNLSQVNAPYALFYSDDDHTVHPKNVVRLYNSLPNAVLLYRVPQRGFNHFDFIFGRHAEEFIFRNILKLIDKYSHKVTQSNGFI